MKFTGSKFDKNLSTKEIAARVRQEIKEAVKTGDLPKAKYSVRIDCYSMGSSIDVVIRALPFSILNPKRIELEAHNPRFQWQNYESEPRHTLEASAVLGKVEQLLSSYNFDNSDSMTDYFDVKFYGHVKFDWREESAERDLVLAKIVSVQSVA